ncbi:MAG: hypothetical protein ACFFDB_12245 [Promethearchaeota archaeon]
MNEKNKKILDKLHPLIIESEEKEIQTKKPPNDKIISYNLINQNPKD